MVSFPPIYRKSTVTGKIFSPHCQDCLSPDSFLNLGSGYHPPWVVEKQVSFQEYPLSLSPSRYQTLPMVPDYSFTFVPEWQSYFPTVTAHTLRTGSRNSTKAVLLLWFLYAGTVQELSLNSQSLLPFHLGGRCINTLFSREGSWAQMLTLGFPWWSSG